MATTNNNKPVDMKQLWQSMEPFPVTASAISGLTTAEDGKGRFKYYLNGANFYRYDTYSNTNNKLASPLLTPTAFASIRYSRFSGTYGRVIFTPSSTTLRIAGFNAGIFDGKVIRIISGAGAGQVRTIASTLEPVKYEQGLATVATTATIGDSTKKWKINQWVGYQVRLTYGAGQTQVRRILYNDANTLTVFDANYQPIDMFNNSAFVVSPSATAGAQTHFVIEASDLTVNTAWAVNPDYTSRFKIESGGLWLLTSSGSAPYFSIQYYDEATDIWQYKTTPTNMILAAFGTDGTIERTSEVGGIYVSGTASSGSTYVLTDSSKTMTPNAYNNYRIRITGGTGVGQQRRIIKNNATTIEVARRWQVTPDNTSTYEIIADKDKFYIAGNAQSFLAQYDLDSDLVIQGSKSDDGIACNLSAQFLGIDTPTIAITSGTRGTGGITAATVNTAGSGYVVGDFITLTTGTNGKVQVTSIGSGGAVTGISLLRPGTGYSVTTFAQSATTGVGTGFVANVTAIGTVCNVVTAINHNFKIGDSVVLAGDSAYAGTVTIIGSDSINGFDFVTAASGNMTAASSQSATVIVDSSKNWTVNEHVGKIIQTHLVGTSGAVQPRVIVSNTATTITVATITTALVNGNSRYVIIDPAMFGRDEQFKDITKNAYGDCTGGSTTTLVDSTKNWNTNQWAGAKVRIQSGTGRDNFLTITSNTATTLTYSTQTFTPDSTSRYIIFDSFGTCTGAGTTSTLVDTTKNWAVNQWAGKRVRITGGTGFGLAAAYNEIVIVSNTSNTLTFTAITGLAPDVTTTYTILGVPARGAGIEAIWVFGGASAGKYIFLPRGSGSNTADRYNIITETFEYSIFFNPQTDIMNAGTYYAYDGVNRIYFSPAVSAGAVQYVYYFDMTTNKIQGFGAVPNTQGTASTGNRMEIVSAPSGIGYLYHMRNGATEMYRAQIWF
jgi:hypothetical protein